jgi:hypothetical protein
MVLASAVFSSLVIPMDVRTESGNTSAASATEQQSNADKSGQSGYSGRQNISVIPYVANPTIFGRNCESSIIMDGAQMDMWFATGTTLGDGGFQNLWYTYADNATLTNFASPIKVLDNIRFPCVVKDDTTYYCFGVKAPYAATTCDIYVWTSTDKTNWTIGNGGTPVLHRSTNVDSQFYSIWNNGVVVINHVFYMWVECATQAGTDNQWGVRLGFSYSNVADLNFDTHKSENNVVDKAGNPCPYFVPDRNGIILMYGLMTNGIWQIRSSVINMENDLTNRSSYWGTNNFYLGPDNEQTADPAMTVATGKPYPIIMQWSHNQPRYSDLYQGYIDMTLNALFDEMNNGTKILATPYAPSDLTTRSGNGWVNLSWSAALTNGSAVSNYNIFRGTSAGSEAYLCSTTQLYLNNTGLTSGQIYYYQVSAINSAGQGPLCDEVYDTPYTIHNHATTISDPFYSGLDMTIILPLCVLSFSFTMAAIIFLRSRRQR